MPSYNVRTRRTHETSDPVEELFPIAVSRKKHLGERILSSFKTGLENNLLRHRSQTSHGDECHQPINRQRVTFFIFCIPLFGFV